MYKNKQSLKTIFAEALGYYNKRDYKTAEVFCYKILSIDSNHFDSLSLLRHQFELKTMRHSSLSKAYMTNDLSEFLTLSHVYYCKQPKFITKASIL